MYSKGVNKVTIIGNLGKDPEMASLSNGTPVAKFSVATSEYWKDKQTGERKEHTEWHRIVLKGRPAEIANSFLKKGSKVYLEGSNRTRSWKDEQGVERWMTEVHCYEMQMLDSKRDLVGGYDEGVTVTPEAAYQQVTQQAQKQQYQQHYQQQAVQQQAGREIPF